jgi:exopolyphosphatase/guanosine-5'-triphosphate,3'-diphosphate pyrophosphatase
VSSSSDAGRDRDTARIVELLGRTPRGDFDVVVRTRDGDPVVVRNAPLLHDGTPMPTRYWLVGERESVLAGRLESAGGVDEAESAIDPESIAETHRRYAAERDAQIPADHTGPRPSGGVGGTRIGVKCLHAHLGNWLAGNDDPVGEWTASRSGISRDDYVIDAAVETSSTEVPVSRASRSPIAVIDVGTNSTNLLIADGNGTEIERRVTVTRLGRDLAATAVLSDDSIRTTLACLAAYRAAIDHHGATLVRVAATEACRRATNSRDFIDPAENILGVRPQILDGTDEGRLAYRGAIASLGAANGTTLVIDIGGGSTELMLGDDRLRATLSVPIGAVTVTETELHRDPPRPEELTNAIGLAADYADDFIRMHPEVLGVDRVIGVAGTIVTVAAVELGLRAFDRGALHGLVLPREAIEDVFRTLATESLEDRRHNPGLPPDRADVIVGGTCILVGLLRRLHVSHLTVSIDSILDGMVMEELHG